MAYLLPKEWIAWFTVAVSKGKASCWSSLVADLLRQRTPALTFCCSGKTPLPQDADIRHCVWTLAKHAIWRPSAVLWDPVWGHSQFQRSFDFNNRVVRQIPQRLIILPWLMQHHYHRLSLFRSSFAWVLPPYACVLILYQLTLKMVQRSTCERTVPRPCFSPSSRGGKTTDWTTTKWIHTLAIAKAFKISTSYHYLTTARPRNLFHTFSLIFPLSEHPT